MLRKSHLHYLRYGFKDMTFFKCNDEIVYKNKCYHAKVIMSKNNKDNHSPYSIPQET